jgi:hypothetical protein
MTHLTLESWRRLREGRLEPSERAAVLQHLTQACDDCEELVAGLDEPVLDCTVDAALASLPAEPASASLVFHRLERRILARTFPRSRRAWWAAVPIALAAGAALFVVHPFAAGDPGQRLKGKVLRPPALTAVVSVKKGSALEAVQPPHAYPNTAELYFTYDLPQDSHVYLGRVGVDGVVEPFYPPLGVSDAVEPAGLHSLTVGGTVHAYSLEGLRGKQRFVLLSSPTSLEGTALQKALKEASADTASLEVEVEGW